MPELIAEPAHHLNIAQFRTPSLNVIASTDIPAPFVPPSAPPSEAGIETTSTAYSTGLATPRIESTALDTFIAENETSTTASSPSSDGASTVTNGQHSSTTCVVCMDNHKDIVLAPCQHSHCCLSCFRRSQVPACPICRTPVQAVIVLSSGMELPVSSVAPKSFRDRSVQMRSSGNLNEPLSYETPRSFQRRPNMSSMSIDEERFTAASRTASVSSFGVARQAESSVRSLPRSQDAAFRRLRETGSVDLHVRSSLEVGNVPERRHTISSAGSIEAAGRRVLPLDGEPNMQQNIVLLGHTRQVLVSLAQRLLATFPRSDERSGVPKSKSTVYIDGKPIRLVLIECPMFSMSAELIARVQRQSPKLVLLCADFFNVASFESIVRLDMEMLDYLNIPSIWVLVKSINVTKVKKRTNIVEEADVRTAKHFLGKPRKCFVAQVDGPLSGAATRKLGLYIHRSFCRDGPSESFPAVQEQKSPLRTSRSFGLFCMSADRQSKRRTRRANRSSSNLTRWLC